MSVSFPQKALLPLFLFLFVITNGAIFPLLSFIFPIDNNETKIWYEIWRFSLSFSCYFMLQLRNLQITSIILMLFSELSPPFLKVQKLEFSLILSKTTNKNLSSELYHKSLKDAAKVCTWLEKEKHQSSDQRLFFSFLSMSVSFPQKALLPLFLFLFVITNGAIFPLLSFIFPIDNNETKIWYEIWRFSLSFSCYFMLQLRNLQITSIILMLFSELSPPFLKVQKLEFSLILSKTTNKVNLSSELYHKSLKDAAKIKEQGKRRLLFSIQP
ncbi:uncharacterized protein [Coffea arabica]|uniref:Uncharacterized protein isoform X2 n=1 Tax=Coffea arabica TaxID=13443 RepID=A0ABM4X1K3_COFAR